MSRRALNPNQLKMFMTPREIEAEYQPMDGDRKDVYSETQGTNDPRAASNTHRAWRTDGVTNKQRRDLATGDPAPHYQRPSEYWSSSSTTPETDDELWDRKYSEAQDAAPEGFSASYDSGGGDDGPYFKRPGTSMPTINSGTWEQGKTRPVAKRDADGSPMAWRATQGHTTYESRNPYANRIQFQETSANANQPTGHSMADSIETQGVLSPLRLGSKVGSSGKKQIVGGHHRMAVARAVAPDTLVPVLHHEDISEARSNNTTKAYKYT